MDYTISSRKVFYNTLTKTEVANYSGKAGEVIFDSVGEFKCYLLLKRFKLPIQIHKLNEALKWKVDFTMKFIGERAKRNPLLTRYGYSLNRNNELLIEFKGVLDDKTVTRVCAIPDIIRKSLVIVSNSGQSITTYDKVSNELLKIPTISIKELGALTYASKTGNV